MIRELAHKPSNKGFDSNSRGVSKSSYNKNQTQSQKKMRNELNINIPNYLMDKSSEKHLLNKSNEFQTLTTNNKKTPTNSAGKIARTTTAKEKKYIDNIMPNKSEAINFNITSIDNEKTLDTTYPTKQTLIKDKNHSQNNYYSTTNNINLTSPNGNFERSDLDNLNSSSYNNNSNLNNLSIGKASGKNFNSTTKNSNAKNFNLHSSNSKTSNRENKAISNKNLKNGLNNININNNTRSKSREKLNNSSTAGFNIQTTREKREYSDYQTRSPSNYSNNNLKRSFDAASKNKSINRPKSTKNAYMSSTGRNSKFNPNHTNNKADLTEGDNFEENVMVLEKLINEIKSKGFDKFKGLIDEKMQMKKILEVRIENYQKLLNMKNAEKKNYGQNNSKIETDSDLFKKLAERCMKENPVNFRTLNQLKKEISEMKESYAEKLGETKVIMNTLCEDQQMVHAIKEEIKKVNKMNSELNKEKDSMRNGINLLKKHVELLKEKINDEKQKSKEFIKNVSCFVDENLKKK